MEWLKNMVENVKIVKEGAIEKWDETTKAMREDSKGWYVCLAVLLVTVVRSGLTYSFGMFIVKLESQFHSSMAEQNWIGTLSFCISLSASPISVSFIRCFGHKGYRIGGLVGTAILSVSTLASSFVTSLEWLFFTHSLLYGIGSSLIYMSSSLVIGEHFGKEHKYHVLATSILLCGYPIGSLIFNPVHAWLIESFTWQAAFRVTSGLILVTGIICCWNFSPKEHSDMENIPDEDDVTNQDGFPEEEEVKKPWDICTWREIRHKPEILLWYLGNMLSYLGFYMPFMNLAHYMQRRDITTKWSSLALIMLSLSECITYMIASILGDYLKDRLIYVNIASSGALAVICLVWPLIDVTYGMILVISLAMGGFLGLNIVYTYAASGEITGLPIDVAWSFTNMWSGMGILVGPLFNGFVYDLKKSYADVFFVVGGIYLIATALFAGIPLIHARRERKQLQNPDANVENIRISNIKPPPQDGYKDLQGENTAGLYIEGPVPATMATVVQSGSGGGVNGGGGRGGGFNPFQAAKKDSDFGGSGGYNEGDYNEGNYNKNSGGGYDPSYNNNYGGNEYGGDNYTQQQPRQQQPLQQQPLQQQPQQQQPLQQQPLPQQDINKDHWDASFN